MANNPRKYFSNILVIFRVSPHITLLTLNGLVLYRLIKIRQDEEIDLTEKVKSIEQGAKCFTTMLLWFNFFLLLRYIKRTAYLAQIIIEVFKDIKVFLVILVMSIFAFTSAFHTIKHEDDRTEEHSFTDILISVMVMTMGEPDTSLIEHNQIGLIIFLATALFNLIVMLNILIAIVTETYERVKSDKYKFLFSLKVEAIATL